MKNDTRSSYYNNYFLKSRIIGRLQMLEEASCQCHEDTTTPERIRIKGAYFCSKPHLCRPAKTSTAHKNQMYTVVFIIAMAMRMF